MTSQLTNGPFTIGIFGEWRTGKTSLMRMVEDCLDDQDKIVTVPPPRGRMENFSTSLLKRLKTRDAAAFKERLPLIGPACGHSPRAMVRFVNNLLIDEAINLAMAERGDMKRIDVAYFAITRALQQTWPRMFDLLERAPKLCEQIAEADLSDLGSLDLPEGSAENQAFSRLTDPDLRTLLSSAQGKDWLQDEKTRTAAIQFLETQRQEPGATSARFGELVIAFHPGDLKAAQLIGSFLEPSVPQLTLAPSERPVFTGPEAAAVWVLGSRWRLWEANYRADARVQWMDSPLFIVLLPEARESTLANTVPIVLAISIQEYPISDDDLLPLLRAIRRLPWRSSFLDAAIYSSVDRGPR